jgi:hypothetical protein
MVGRPCPNFFTFCRNDKLSPPSFSINQTTIVTHRALNLDVISNHNQVIESKMREQEEAGHSERAESKGSSSAMYPEK